MSAIGFIGLGIMGRPMAKNLLRAGHQLVVFDLTQSAVDELVESHADKGISCADVASRSDLVITMLPDGPDVEKAVLGRGGVLDGARSGSTLVDMSSINPAVSQKIDGACAAKGIAFVDSPVSGGEPKAIAGTLALWWAAIRKCSKKLSPS
jgi:2-hydroxy-3-oxopropionate reductase